MLSIGDGSKFMRYTAAEIASTQKEDMAWVMQ